VPEYRCRRYWSRCPAVDFAATNSQVHHSNGQGMAVLPTGQGPQAYPPPASRHSGTTPLLRPHTVHVDLVGLLPPSRGNTYLFTVIDRTSQSPEAIPLSSISIAVCARALILEWISRYGVSAIITADRGAQFISALWAALCNLLSISHTIPQQRIPSLKHGLVEWFHMRLKETLQARAAAANWCDHLPWVMLGCRVRLSTGPTKTNSSTPPSCCRRPSRRRCRPPWRAVPHR
jgi:hypothetical protein